MKKGLANVLQVGVVSFLVLFSKLNYGASGVAAVPANDSAADAIEESTSSELPESVYTPSDYEKCLLNVMEAESDSALIIEIKQQCIATLSEAQNSDLPLGPLSRRILSERRTQWNRHVITAYDQNYILPYSYSSNPNGEAYANADDWEGAIKNQEVKFQLSLKIPITKKNIFRKYDAVYFGLTMTSWWQIYAQDISAPFRETNYQPEMYYVAPVNWRFLGGNTGIQLGFAHQSNGHTQTLSRSWNRLYTAILYEKGDLAFSLRPWYRIPESAKKDSNDAKGDDNPDIDDYMGYFDLRGAYRSSRQELSFIVRNNLRSDNKGAIELGYSFPLSGHLKGFVQYFNGYGESLIDYNHKQQRLGVGILLTDWL